MAPRWHPKGQHLSSFLLQISSVSQLTLALSREEALTARTTRHPETESGTMWSARDSGFASRCFQRGPQVGNSSVDGESIVILIVWAKPTG